MLFMSTSLFEDNKWMFSIHTAELYNSPAIGEK